MREASIPIASMSSRQAPLETGAFAMVRQVLGKCWRRMLWEWVRRRHSKRSNPLGTASVRFLSGLLMPRAFPKGDSFEFVARRWLDSEY